HREHRQKREPAGACPEPGGTGGLRPQNGHRPSRSSQVPLLQDSAAWQGTLVPSQGAPIGDPAGVVPHDAPESTLPSQKQGAPGAPTMQTRGEQVTPPVSLLPWPSLL